MSKRINMKTKIPPWHAEIQEAIKAIGFLYCLSPKDLVPFLTATLSGQFALAGYSEEFVKKALERIFESYLNIKKRLDNKKSI